MPKPLPIWIAEEALESYVYVLPGEYYPQAGSQPLFYAKVGDELLKVDKNTVHDFLLRYCDRVFITYDAIAFHAACLNAIGGVNQRQAVWDLSRRFRLWDLALLKMRINYASSGFVQKIEKAAGLTKLVTEKGADKEPPATPFELLSCFRGIFQNQVQWAINNLPLFHTFRDESNVPQPVSIDTYCDILDSARICRYAGVPIPEGGIIDWPGSLDDVSSFRRRDLILTGTSGPFGIGLDLQTAIVADHLKRQC